MQQSDREASGITGAYLQTSINIHTLTVDTVLVVEKNIN